MFLKLLPWLFLLLMFCYICYITYRYFERNPPEEDSKEYFKNIDKDDFV